MKIIPIVNTTSSNNTVCDLKWNYPMFNLGRGEYRTCCRSPGNKVTIEELETLKLNSFLNHPRELKHRLDMLKGIKIESCKSCWVLEENGLKSPREPKRFHYYMRNRKYIDKGVKYDSNKIADSLLEINDIDHPALKSFKPAMIEIILNNICDMKCMYCSHHYSSQWAAEKIKYGEILESEYENEFPKVNEEFEDMFWKWYKIFGIHTQRLGIIGGEPLITPQFYEMIEKLILIEQTRSIKRSIKMNLYIVTNMNTPDKFLDKFHEILPKLDNFFDLEIIISMESLGSQAEYIRNGLEWERFQKNLHKLLSRRDLNFRYSFVPTINVLSIGNISNFIEYVTDLYYQYKRPFGLRQNIVTSPNWQSPNILTPEFANCVDKAIEYMEKNVSLIPELEDKFGRYSEYIIFLSTISNTIKNNKESDHIELRKEFIKWFSTYDQRRNLNLRETFPEYKEFFSLCENL